MTLLNILKFFFKKRKQSSLSNKERISKKYDVFLCKKSEDVNIAKEICTFLENNGLTCFLSERDCPFSGQPNYYQTIDEALDNPKPEVKYTGATVQEALDEFFDFVGW